MKLLKPLNDFKKFLFRGNVVDLAVAVIIGTAFGAVVKALVADILTPIIALIFGKPDFSALTFTINSSHFLYGDFINNVEVRRRIALDIWPDFAKHLEPDVEAVVAPVTDLTAIADGSVDYAFASNLFEHIPQSDFAHVLHALRGKLSARGTLTILQPNYRYASREYFDDYTHVAIWSHVSLADFLTAID